jgi:TRAP-type C4-dicarboxylate transport system substrate-binding protein
MKRLLLASTAILATALAAHAQEVTFRLSHWLPPQHAVAETGMVEWTDSITAASNGTIKFEIFPAQQLGAAADHYDMTRDGIVDIGYVNPGYTAGRFPIYELTGVPFLASTGPAAGKAIHEWYAGDYAEAEMSDVYFCLVNPHNPGRFHGNQMIRVPADVNGLNVRPAHSTMARFINSLGGSSVQVPAPEAREAIARGTADAVTIPYEAMKVFSLAEVTKFHNDMPLYLSSQVMLFNLDSYDRLTDDQKTVIDEHCTPDWSQRFSEGWAVYDEGVRQEMIASPDHEVYMPSEEEIGLWREAAQSTKDSSLEDVAAAGHDAETVWNGLIDALAANDASY